MKYVCADCSCACQLPSCQPIKIRVAIFCFIKGSLADYLVNFFLWHLLSLAGGEDGPGVSAARLARWAFCRWQHRVEQKDNNLCISLLDEAGGLSADVVDELAVINRLMCGAVGLRQPNLWSSLDCYLQSTVTLCRVALHSGYGLSRWAQPQLADAIKLTKMYNLAGW